MENIDWTQQTDEKVVRLRGGFTTEKFKAALAQLKDFKTVVVCFCACVIWHSPTLVFFTEVKAKRQGCRRD